MLLFIVGLLPWICLCFRQGRAEETGTSKVEREKKKERTGEKNKRRKERVSLKGKRDTKNANHSGAL